MELTESQREVLDMALEGKNLFITGPGGSGKSFLLKVLVEELRRKWSKRAVAVTAMTGLAAIPIGGTTLHSFAGMGHDLRKRPSSFAMKRWGWTKVLIVDESSMLTDTFLEKLYPFLKNIQLILFGDFYQLPPVKGDPCFLSKVWKELGLSEGTHVLSKVIRQKDDSFVKVLNEVRVGNLTKESIEFLRKLEITQKEPDLDKVTKLYALNRDVESENLDKLDTLDTPLLTLYATDTYVPPRAQSNRVLGTMIDKEAPAEIRIKVGARVMLTRNMQGTTLVNGSIGTIEDISVSGVPLVRFNEYPEAVRIERIDYKVVLGKDTVTRSQFPLKLAWAITIHKAQGMTLDNVLATVNGSFERGQIYTVLSRVRTSEGLYIDDVDYLVKNNKTCKMAKSYYKKVV